MYRVVVLSGKAYACKIEGVRGDTESIEELVNTGSVVIICNDLEDLEEYGIEPGEIETVE